MIPPAPAIRLATAYEELAYVALSSVGVAAGTRGATRAAVLQRVDDPRLVTTTAIFDENQEALTYLAGDGLLVAQNLPRLFSEVDDLPSFLRRAGRARFADLTTFAETDGRTHATMARGDTRLSELLLCDMALASEAFVNEGFPALQARATAALADVRGALEELAAIVPAVLEPKVVVCAALGFSGRVFHEAGNFTVHAGVTNHEAGGREAALLVLHEIAVARARAPYAEAERAAIDAVGRCVKDTSFADDYDRRLARFSLANLPPEGGADAIADEVCRAIMATTISS